MKNLLRFMPVLFLVLFMFVSTKLFADGQASPTTLILLMGVMLLLVTLGRPKNKGAKPASNLEQKVRGEFAKDAFSDNPQLEAKFQAAMKDYNGNMPKAALTKLTKLAPLCTTDPEIYAVALATATCHLTLGKPALAVREYTRALSLHATTDVAVELGSCYQRQGNLEKARSFYEFALDLDENNLEARSILATTYVADGDYETALEQAQLILEKDEKNASALATAAICYGLTGETLMYKSYTDKAVENGYSKKKIEETVAALKKR